MQRFPFFCNMKRILCGLICLISTAVSAQTPTDSTDMFWRHLELNEVVVSGMTGETKLKNSSATITVVSNLDLRQHASSNLIDAIALQPGVAQITTGSAISKPVIRGLGYNRLLVINDGVRQEGQQWGDEHGIEVDQNNVGSVEILRGPASLMYGSDAMAGVLLLKSAPIVPEGEIHASAATEYQSNSGLFGYSANFAGHKQGFVWNARWSQRLAHAYKNKYDGYVPGSGLQEHSASAMLGLNRRWGYSHLTLSHYELTPGSVEGERDAVTGQLLHDADLKTYGHTLPYQRVEHTKAVWENQLYIGDGRLQATLGYQQNRRREYEEALDACGIHLLLHTMTYDVRYMSGEREGWQFTTGAGGMWQRSLNKGEEFLIPSYRLFDVGVFAMAQKEAGRWSLSGGLRYDHRSLHSESLTDGGVVRFSDFHRQFSAVTGSVGAVLHINDKVNARVNLARGFRAPNMSELGSNGVHEGTIRYEVGSNQLKPEHSLQLDMGLDLSSRYMSLQFAFFANRIDNFIFAHRTAEVIDPGHPTFRYLQGDARLIGFELFTDLHPIHSLHWENTFSYVDARQLHQPADKKYLPFTPAPRWTSDVKVELTHDGRVLNNAYVSAGLECYLCQNHYYRADDTETATPGYALLNIGAGTDILCHGHKLCEVYLSVNNVLDKAYQSHLSRLKYADRNAVTGRVGVYNMGRNLTVKLLFPIL